MPSKDLAASAGWRVPPAHISHQIVVRVSDDILRLVIIATLADAAIATTDVDDGVTPVITDDTRTMSLRTLLVIEPTPGVAQEALSALVDHRLGGAVLRRKPECLVPALLALSVGLASVSQDLCRLAGAAPQLAQRQRQVLALVAAGLTHTLIAERLGLSIRTVKREVTDLMSVFNCTTRHELTLRAMTDGFVERRSG